MPNTTQPVIPADDTIVATNIKKIIIDKNYGSDCPVFRYTERDGSIWQTKYVHLKDSRDLICSEVNNINAEIRSAGIDELKVFNAVADAVRNDDIIDVIDLITAKTDLTKEACIQNILKVAKNELGAPYNYNFDFLTFKYLSCVEFVWYCYKSLYILHNVKRRFFYYFNFLKTCVIVPDSFIGSNFFDVVYTSYKDKDVPSLPGDVNYKKELIRSFRKKHFNVWLFILQILAWEIVLLLLLYSTHFLYIKYFANR